MTHWFFKKYYRNHVTSHTGCVSRNDRWFRAVAGYYESHPTRDVWVEIVAVQCLTTSIPVTSHTGCVSRNQASQPFWDRRCQSHPTRDVWVEICYVLKFSVSSESHPTRDVWVEIVHSTKNVARSRSHPTRDVWVEILFLNLFTGNSSVTSHTGCVSRNYIRRSHCFTECMSHPTRDVWVEIK